MSNLIPLQLESVKDYGQYAYPLGCLRAVENKLIPRKRMLEFASVRNIEELLKGLEDTEYGPYLTRAKTPEEREEAVERALAAEFEQVTFLLPEKKRWVVNLFRIKYDFNNLRMLFKAKFASESQAPRFSSLGTISAKQLSALWPLPLEQAASKLAAYTPQLKKALLAYQHEKENKVRAFDFSLERETFAYLFTQLPLDREGDFFRNYLMIEIDLHNILSCLRAKREKREGSFGNCYIPGGTLSEDRIRSLDLAITPYGYLWDKARPEFEQSGSLTAFERLGRRHLMQFVHEQSMLKSLDPEVVAAYVLRKEQEAWNVRLLLGLKAKEVPAKLAEKLVGDEYA